MLVHASESHPDCDTPADAGLSTCSGSDGLALSALADIGNTPPGLPSARDLSLSGALRGLCSEPDDDPAAFATCDPASGARQLRISPPPVDVGLLWDNSESDGSVPTPHLGAAREHFRTPAGDSEPAAELPQSAKAGERYMTPLESEPSQGSASPAEVACDATGVSPLTGLPLGAALQCTDMEVGAGSAGAAQITQLASKLPRAPKKRLPAIGASEAHQHHLLDGCIGVLLHWPQQRLSICGCHI